MFLRLELSLNSNKICLVYNAIFCVDRQIKETNEVKFKFFFDLSVINVIEQMIYTSARKKIPRLSGQKLKKFIRL